MIDFDSFEAEFLRWLDEYDDDWRSEYSGNIKFAHDAWLAGKKTAESHVSHSPEIDRENTRSEA